MEDRPSLDSIDAYPRPRYDLDTRWMLLADSFNESVRTPFEIDSHDSATFNHVFDQRPNDSMTDSNWSDAKIRSISSVRRIDERLVMLNSIVPCNYFRGNVYSSCVVYFPGEAAKFASKNFPHHSREIGRGIKFLDFLGLTRISRDS